jgi:hypothetical protein
MKKLLLISMVMGLSACVSTPSPTLSEKLQGKSPAERKEILRLTCLNEAEQTIQRVHRPSGRHRYVHHYSREEAEMKALCREMDNLSDAEKGDLK